MNARLEVEELELRLLHALLLEHNGLNVEDVASELGVTRQKAESLLAAEQRAGVVDLRVDDSVYVSLRKTKSASSAAARSELALARRGREAARTKKRAILMGVPIATGAVALGWYGATHTPPRATPEPARVTSVSSPPRPAAGPSLDERVDARLAGERRRQWELEAADREHRIAALDAAATAASCATKWSKGSSCYVSHRNMSQAEFDEERAILSSELASVRRLLEQSR